MKKRLLSLLLVFVMVLGMLPVTALAEDTFLSVTADGSAAELTYLGYFADKQYYGGYQIPVYYATVSEAATLDITYSEDYLALGSDYYNGLEQGALTGVTKADLEAYFTTASNYNLDTANSVAYIEFATNDGYYSSAFGLLIELAPASSGSTGPVSVTADGSAVEVTSQGAFADKQYWGASQIPVYYAKVSDTATLSITWSEDYLALGSDYFSSLDQGALTGVTRADLEAYFTTASDYGLDTTNSVAYIEFATNDGYYTSVFGLLIELEPVVVTTYTVTLPSGEGYSAAAYGESASPVEAGGSYSFTVTVADGYDGTNMAVMANDTVLTADNGVYTITDIQADQIVTVTGVEKKATGPVSVTADGSAAELTYLGYFADKQYYGGYQIPVYYATVSEAATLDITYSEDYLALGSDYYNGLEQGALTGVTKADLEAYFTTAADYSLDTANSVAYIEFATNDGYYSSTFGLLIEFVPASDGGDSGSGDSGSGDSGSGNTEGGITGVASSTNEEEGAVVSNAFDGDYGTYWATAAGGSLEDSYLIADLGGTCTINKVEYTKRYDSNAGYNCTGNLLNYVIEVSTDGETWTQVAAGETIDGTTVIEFEPVQAAYVRLTSTSSYHWDSAQTNTVMCAAELAVFKTDTGDTDTPAPTTYTVTLPTGEGYVTTASGDSASPVAAGGSYSFTVAVIYGYDSSAMKVMANGSELTASEGVYTITNISADQTVTVTGVVKKTSLPGSDDYITISVEKYDADGNGSFLLNPKRLLKEAYVNDYVIPALQQALGSGSYVKYATTQDNGSVYSVTAIYDQTQDDSYLNNGDLEGYSWQVLVNNEAWSGRDYNADYKLQGGDVIRFIYTNETAAGQTDKDDLVQLAAEVSDEVQETPAYQDALDTIVSRTASDEDVASAIAALQDAMVVSATAVEITAGESVELKVNQSLTLEAAVLPADTTEELVWSTSDSGIVNVDAASGRITGVSAGEATVTVTCGSATDTIKVNVTAVEAESVTITNGDVSVEARFSVQLEAAITPENSTELVVWSVADESIATVDASGKLTGVSVGETTVTATAGAVSHTVKVTVTETTSTYVYFQYTDGRVQEMKDDTFTLTVLDEGSFVVGNTTAAATWSCSEYVSNDDGTNQYNYWISSDGKYQPHGAKEMTATVNAGGYYKTFTIKTVPSGISQIKVYIDDQERNAENPYSVTGMATTWITVNGLNEAGEWVYIPIQALEITSSDTNIVRFLGNQMSLIREGSADITISMLDNSEVSTSFEAICNTVKVTGIDVHVPEVFIIDKWDSMGNVYVGIYQGYDDPDTQYYVYYTPSNATNQDLIWEDLTPEIAVYDEGWSTGIVPKKAGTAKFKVTSVSNPEVSQEVTIKFVYKTPLESVECPQETFEMTVGDSVDPGLIFTPSNATETRFNWTYSQNGIVQVKETVTSSGYARVVSRKIIALANGTVTVTGTPVDDTAGCQSVTFTVTVGSSGDTEEIDYLKMAKEDIAHGLEYLQGQNQASYGNEWTIFTNLRAGGYMDAQMRIIYLQSVADELKNYTEDKQPTDYARVVLTLPLLDADPENFEGIDLVEKLYNANLENQTSNQICWTLLALDSRNYEIPEDALWNRDELIAKILTFQNSDGSFGLSTDGSGSVDMTGMILQSLAPYYNSSYPQVQSAVNKALEYLKDQRNENVGYIAEGGENSCTAAQVLTALAALGIDPTDPDNGFTLGAKNLVTNLHSFRQNSGFAYLLGESTNLMGTQQTTYALEAYRRWAEGQNALYDLTDLDRETETVTYEVTLPTGEGYAAEAADGSGSPVAAGGRYTFTVTLADGYTKDENFAVKANGITLTEAEGVYTIKNIRENQVITVEGVRKALENETFTVSLPSGEGYVAEAADGSGSPVEYGGSYSFTVTVAEGYEKTGEFAVKVNGTTLIENNGKYTIENIKANQTVTVTGVRQKVGTITVRFSLLGCYKHADGENAVHTLFDGNLQTWVEAREYEVPADSTVKDILETVLSQNGMTVINPDGNYVKYIVKDGVRIGEFTNGTYSGWMYTLNGTHSNLGVAEQTVKDGDVIVFHYTDDYTREDGSQGNSDEDADAQAAEAAEKLIDAIGTVTLNSADEIEAARKAYDALTYTQKQLVDNYATLTAAEARYAQLKAADDEKKASAVEDLIDELDSDSAAFGEDVQAAKDAYDGLTDDQKALVDNYGKLADALKELASEEDGEAAEAVEKLIGELGDITLDSEEDIKAARDAYEALTDGQKALVGNLDVLIAAEKKLEDRKALAGVADIYKTTGDYLEALGTPVPGSTGGEWMVIGLARSGREIAGVEDYYASVLAYVQENIDENERLHRAKSTDNSRMILALTAIGKDVTDVDGHDLLLGLNSMEFIQKQGINGPIWALIAFDSGNYPVPAGDVTREALIQTILDAQLADGGWALSGDTSDSDMTGMAVQALAPYYNTDADVKKALDEAVETMSRMQAADGSFGSVDGSSSESISQVIVALAALGIDADKDERFVKNGISALDALCAFYVEGGGFRHVMDGKLDGMATEQGYYALTAYFRMLDGKTGLYNMTDVTDMGGDAEAVEPTETSPVETKPEPAETEPVPVESEEKGGFPWWILIVILVAGAAIAVIVNRKRIFANVR